MEALPLLRRERGTASVLAPAGNGHTNSKTVPVAGKRKDELKENVPTRYISLRLHKLKIRNELGGF